MCVPCLVGLRQASAFVLFPDLKSACDAVLPLKQSQCAVAVELHDFSSLRLAESPLQQLVPQLTTAQEGAAALLIQVKGDTAQHVADTISRAQGVLSSSGVKFGGQADKPLGVESYPFSTDPKVSRFNPAAQQSRCCPAAEMQVHCWLVRH